MHESRKASGEVAPELSLKGSIGVCYTKANVSGRKELQGHRGSSKYKTLQGEGMHWGTWEPSWRGHSCRGWHWHCGRSHGENPEFLYPEHHSDLLWVPCNCSPFLSTCPLMARGNRAASPSVIRPFTQTQHNFLGAYDIPGTC